MVKRVKKIAIFGGSFDPIHKGHIELALESQKAFDLDEVHFVLAKEQPQKPKALFEAEERFAMLELAIKPHRGFIASRLELERENPSYSCDTIAEFKELYPKAKLYWLIGSDAFVTLDSWKKPEYIKENIDFIVYPRQLSSASPSLQSLLEQDKSLKASVLDCNYINLSSTEIRERLLDKESITAYLPGEIDELLRLFYSKKTMA